MSPALSGAAMALELALAGVDALASLQRSFPDLTVTWCAQSDVLQPEAKSRVLDGLARAGLPR
ncbi:hypothetical protein [Falsiroseomonas sp. E2-1-a20]|uniref:hypothetical protein n=1 Tax=Falsiroseomonas sp. E2-1-a20 TaxID=3239300 RepID=UPI003F404DF0